MKTKLKTQTPFFNAARRFVFAIGLIMIVASAVAAQTNTFPSSGNAGVGTTSPTIQSGTTNTMIEVKGTVNPGVGITSTAAGGRQFFVYSSQTNPGYFSVFDATAGADRFVINNIGNVGIGTATPSQKLNVIGNGLFGDITSRTLLYSSFDAQGNQILELGNGTSHSAVTPLPVFVLSNHTTSTNNAEGVIGQIAFANRSIADGNEKRTAAITSWVDGASNSGTLQFYTVSAGTIAERLRITSGGNVGIGIASPAYKLDVQGGLINSSGGLCIAGDCKTAWSQVGGGGGSSQWTTSGTNIYYNSGTVGIGTATPGAGGYGQAKLDVVGRARVRTDGTVSAGVWFNDSSTASGSTDNAFVGRSGSATTGFWTPVGWVLNVHDNGNVGIGTTTPQSTVQIGAQTSTPTGSPTTLSLGGAYSSTAGANLKLKLYDDGNAATIYGIGVSALSMDFGVSAPAGYHWYAGGVNKMTLTSNGDLSVSGSIAAKYQDLAEWVPSAEQLSAGTVVVLDTTKPNQVISSTVGYDTRVAGVISAQPGITLGEGGEGKVLVATTGRVRVKVDASRGPINIGDLLVTSDIPGVAMRSDPVEFAGRKMHMPGTIIGKALAPLPKGRGEILVLLSLQ